MTHRSVRQHRAQAAAQCQGPRYFDPSRLTEEEAGKLWMRCIDAIEVDRTERPVTNFFRVGDMQAELITFHGRTGRLQRFWLRTTVGNHLVIVGNRDGLLPMDVRGLHG